MADLLIYIADITVPFPDLTGRGYARGEVVVVLPDGGPWGPGDRAFPKFRILKSPGMTVTQGLDLLMPFVPADPRTAGKDIPRRAVALNLDDTATLTKAERDQFDLSINRDEAALSKLKIDAIRKDRVLIFRAP